MNIASRFAWAMGRRDQGPNKELAEEIVLSNNHLAVSEIVNVLKTTEDAHTLADGLKVIEMIGEQDSNLASATIDAVLPHLDHQENQIQRRAMSALSTIAEHHQKQLFETLPRLLKIMDAGSVVTRDHGFRILIILYQNENYTRDLSYLIQEQLLNAPDNQLGQYAGSWLRVIQPDHREALKEILEKRLPELTHPSHQARTQKILKKLA